MEGRYLFIIFLDGCWLNNVVGNREHSFMINIKIWNTSDSGYCFVDNEAGEKDEGLERVVKVIQWGTQGDLMDRADYCFRKNEQTWDQEHTQEETSEKRTCRGGLLRAERLKGFVGLRGGG